VPEGLYTGTCAMMDMQLNGVLGLLILAAEVWAVISIFQSGTSNEKKALWIVLVILLPLIGLIVWFFLGPRGGKAIRGG
jgi:succinate dehydrogenase/fumarate reductase cytochrome b subunit